MYWARRSVFSRPGGMDLGLQTSGCRISWFGQRGMTWKQFTPAVGSYLDRHPSPGMIMPLYVLIYHHCISNTEVINF